MSLISICCLTRHSWLWWYLLPIITTLGLFIIPNLAIIKFEVNCQPSSGVGYSTIMPLIICLPVEALVMLCWLIVYPIEKLYYGNSNFAVYMMFVLPGLIKDGYFFIVAIVSLLAADRQTCWLNNQLIWLIVATVSRPLLMTILTITAWLAKKVDDAQAVLSSSSNSSPLLREIYPGYGASI